MKKIFFLFAMFFLLKIELMAQCNGIVKIVTDNAAIHCFGIKSDGTLSGWGYNLFGGLGIGNTTSSNNPVMVGTDNNWINGAIGDLFSLIIKSDGTLWSCGWNSRGQLGIGNTTNQNIPVQVGNSTNWLKVAAGESHSLGIKSDGTLWAWGDNNEGQLGISNTTQQNSPVQVGNSADWIGISAGFFHSLGLKVNGTLWAWGRNVSGQLGIGNTTQQNSPVQVGNSTDWVSVSTGSGHSFGIKSDGSLWAWGNNSVGQLGIGSLINQVYPVQVGISNWASITAGSSHSIGIKSDGSLWAWGANAYGQLGIGSTVQQNNPLQIGNSLNWISVAAGLYYTFGIKSDNSIWSWGNNNVGQLGIGNYTNQLSPVKFYPGLAKNYSNIPATIATGSYQLINSDCDLVCSILSPGSLPTDISGPVSGKVWIEQSQLAYVKRHYEITPANNATTATGRVTLYFLQSEFNDFNATNNNSIKLPTGPNDVAGIANLLIEKRSGTSSNNTGLPATYSGSLTNIDPADNDIIWDAANNWWSVTFDVTGFSGFWVKTISGSLSIKWLSVSGTVNNQKYPEINWQVQEANVKSYEIEKSPDGINFTVCGVVNSKGNGINNYSFTEPVISSGDAYIYYRIKQVEANGKTGYSVLVKIYDKYPQSAINIFPNPVREEMLSISAGADLKNTYAVLYNSKGQQLKIINLKNQSTIINIADFVKGIYYVRFANGKTEKIIKE